MLWWLLMLSAVGGLYFAPELEGPLTASAAEIRLLIAGVLAGICLSFLVSAADARLAASRRR